LHGSPTSPDLRPEAVDPLTGNAAEDVCPQLIVPFAAVLYDLDKTGVGQEPKMPCGCRPTALETPPRRHP